MSYTFHNNTFVSVGDIARCLLDWKGSLDDAFALIKDYESKFPMGNGNLRYFMEGDPRWVVFKRLHPGHTTIKKCQEAIYAEEKMISEDWLKEKAKRWNL